MRSLLLALLAAFMVLSPLPSIAQNAGVRQPVTILISIDGFRPDYRNRGITPTLSRLAAGGVAGAMHPSFPSKTFPNHWTLVTGLRPDRTGITANRIEAPDRKDVFTMATDDPWWWNAAMPIWVDAERAGVRTATLFWPGSNVAWGGVKAANWPYAISGGARPSDWWPYGQAVSDAQRVNGVLDWLRRPAAIRPRFVTLYFDEVDEAGHRYGPDDPRTNAAIAAVDRAIGALTDGLATLGQPANLVIVSDHGMAAVSSARTIALDRIDPPADYHLVETGPYATLAPLPGKEAVVEAALLKPHDHMQCWRKADIPERFHYGHNPRIPPILCLAETGWEIAATTPTTPRTGGDHGYDPMAPEMNALFLANGPAFRSGQTLPAFDNVAIYPLLRDLLGLSPVPDRDGSDAVFRPVLKGMPGI